MEYTVDAVSEIQETGARPRTIGVRNTFLIVALFAAAVYLSGTISPPSLTDDVDAVQAQIARNMLASGDWVTARLDGVAYLEKPPLVYWMIAASYEIFGIHDWATRIPLALSAIALCLLTAAFGAWAFGRQAGFYAGLCMSTCVGLWLFTRVLIPDVILTLTIALGMWAFLRVLDPEEEHPRAWAAALAAAMGLGLLLKSLIALVFPIGAAIVYLLCTRQLFSARVWKRLHLFSGLLIILAIAAPWHILATIRNPPYFAFTLKSGPGQYHGFLWFFFINEQLLRFLNLRYPRDYETVPRLYFWLFHLLWLFPWSVYLPATFKLSYKPIDRAGSTRLMALCWTGFVLVFFTFSTTQEYYSMPVYPALALLLGSAMDTDSAWIRRGSRILAVVTGLTALALLGILVAVRHVPSPGDISEALTHQANYKLSLGHMQDLTLQSFAYLRLPLAIAAVSLCLGAVGVLVWRGQRAFLAAALMMVLFYQAALVAMVRFDPYMSSRPLAEALERAP
ncbi:MAG: glycosyltransferase family 39 protein, partial [Silvibacterium sp.]|nr:glycosyltransferase family 39 protein [Silvibacterium sp.]